MYRVELYAQVRRSVIVEGLSEREAVKRFGLARETVRKMLRYRIPPGYRRNKPVRRPKLEAFTGIINQILNDDRERPRKQRHTAQRIFDRLRDEYEFTGGYTIVKDYVREKKLGGQEMFVPLTHPPGDAKVCTRKPGVPDSGYGGTLTRFRSARPPRPGAERRATRAERSR